MSYPFINKNRIKHQKISIASQVALIRCEIENYLDYIEFEGYERTEGEPVDYTDMVEAESVSFIFKEISI